MSAPENAFRDRYGPWAVVTGASDGIGREFARELAARKFDLVLVARRGAVLQALAGELSAEHGVNCRLIAADLATAEGKRALIESTATLDVGLYIAAAGFGTSGEFIDAHLGEEQQMLAVNCAAVLEQSWHFARRFVARGRGGLVLMSSLLAFQGTPRAANYAATKAYIQTLAEGLRVELKPHGVDVIASAPGPIHSGFAARANMQMSMALAPVAVARTTLDALGHRATVRPGWLSKLLELSLAPLPRQSRVAILAKVMAGMTAHQHRRTVIDKVSSG